MLMEFNSRLIKGNKSSNWFLYSQFIKSFFFQITLIPVQVFCFGGRGWKTFVRVLARVCTICATVQPYAKCAVPTYCVLIWLL